MVTEVTGVPLEVSANFLVAPVEVEARFDFYVLGFSLVRPSTGALLVSAAFSYALLCRYCVVCGYVGEGDIDK